MGLEYLDFKIELFSNKIRQSIAFYKQLGFVVVEEKPHDYTTLRKDALVIALSGFSRFVPLGLFHLFKYPPFGTELVIYVDDLATSKNQLQEAGINTSKTRLQKWGFLISGLLTPMATISVFLNEMGIQLHIRTINHNSSNNNSTMKQFNNLTTQLPPLLLYSSCG